MLIFRAFFVLLFRHLITVGNKGCYRTALELCKLLLRSVTDFCRHKRTTNRDFRINHPESRHNHCQSSEAFFKEILNFLSMLWYQLYQIFWTDFSKEIGFINLYTKFKGKMLRLEIWHDFPLDLTPITSGDIWWGTWVTIPFCQCLLWLFLMLKFNMAIITLFALRFIAVIAWVLKANCLPEIFRIRDIGFAKKQLFSWPFWNQYEN